jgi:hypothetical protein
VLVGCADGTIAVLDAKGDLVRLGEVTGQPTHIEQLETPGSLTTILATANGYVHAFNLAK